MGVPPAARGEEADRGGQIGGTPGQMYTAPPLPAATLPASPARNCRRAASNSPVPIPRR